MKLTKIFSVVALVALPMATYGSGCSSSTSKNNGDGGGSASSSGSGSSSSGATGSSSSGSSSSGSSGSDAAAACTPACPTQCAKEACATPAANTTTGDACDTCINAALSGVNAVCDTPVAAACSGDPDCIALEAKGGCLDGCDTKADGGVPTDDAGADEACFGSDGGVAGCQDCCTNAHPHGTTTILTALIACICCH